MLISAFVSFTITIAFVLLVFIFMQCLGYISDLDEQFCIMISYLAERKLDLGFTIFACWESMFKSQAGHLQNNSAGCYYVM